MRSLHFLKNKFILCISSFILGCTVTLLSFNIERSSPIKDVNIAPLVEPLPSYFLVIFIFSSINNKSKRDAIRETWALDFRKSSKVKYYFVLSGSILTETQKSGLDLEERQFSDLLIFYDLEDSFYLLTSKLLSTLQWTSDEAKFVGKTSPSVKPFHRFSYLLKCDDDTFVRINKITQELELKSKDEGGDKLYWGFFDGRAKPKTKGKYRESQWDICDNYLPYALGGGYVLSDKLVNFLAINAKYLKQYNSEDISVGAWLSSYNGINRVHDPRFDTEYISRGCSNKYLITHKHSEAEMLKLQSTLDDIGELCEKELQTRLSYIYNWDVPPSKCCTRENAHVP